MRDAPRAAIGGAFIEMLEVAGLGHDRIGDPPDHRGRREIPSDQHDGIGQRHRCQVARRSHPCCAAQQIRMWQDHHQHQQRDGADHAAGDHGCGRAQSRPLHPGCRYWQQSLGELA